MGAYLCLNFSRGLLQIFHIFVCNFPGTFLQTNVQKILKRGSRSCSACNALNFFSRILKSEALVYKSYFFEKSRFTKIIRHQILIQILYFLTRLPTRQDGVETRDKVYSRLNPSEPQYFTLKNRFLSVWSCMSNHLNIINEICIRAKGV